MNDIKILFVEDLPTDAEVAQREIAKRDIVFISMVVETEEDYRKALEEYQPDIIISDYILPRFSGDKALRIAKTEFDDIPFIMLTGSINEETAVACMKSGADDYVLKEKISRLPFAVLEVLEKTSIKKEKDLALLDLRRSEEKYHMLVEHINQGLVQVDVDHRILYVNSAFCGIFGFSERELIGKIGYETIIHPDDRDFIKEKIGSRGDISDEKYEARGIMKSGQTIWLAVSASSVKEDKGTLRGSVSLITDITESKRMEQQLKARMDELERFHRLTVGRELTMIELKKEVNELLKELGREEKYKIQE